MLTPKKIRSLVFLALRDVLYALFIHEAELTTVAQYAEVACCSSFITGPK